MIFPNQTEFGLQFSGHWQWSSNFSKPIWIWFGICVSQNQFFFPNQTGIGLENLTQFSGVTFPNQTGFGLEKDTEWNVAALHSASAAYPTLSHTSHLPHKMGLVDHLEQLDNVIILRAGNQQPRDNERCALKRWNQSDVIHHEEANWYSVVREI